MKEKRKGKQMDGLERLRYERELLKKGEAIFESGKDLVLEYEQIKETEKDKMTYDKNFTVGEERYKGRAIEKKEPIKMVYNKKTTWCKK